MRPASISILAAVEQTVIPEDRLTEVLACVAQLNQRFAASLVRMAGLDPDPHERYEVGTQRGTPMGRRVDMEIAAYDAGQARTKLVWVEAKDGARFQPNQLQDYAKEVKDPIYGERNGEVLAIIRPQDTKPADPADGEPRWTTRTWADVASAANDLGHEWGLGLGREYRLQVEAGHLGSDGIRGLERRHWRRAAMARDAPSQWRYLAELIERLKAKGYARMEEPLTPEDVIAAQRRASLSEGLRGLRRGARQRVKGAKATKSAVIDLGWHQLFEPTDPEWLSDTARFDRAYPELLYHHREDWTPEQLGAPAFCAGITFEKPSSATREALANNPWPTDVAVVAGSVAVGAGKVLRVVRTKYLSELIVEGVTLDKQAEALGTWASKTISELMEKVTALGRG